VSSKPAEETDSANGLEIGGGETLEGTLQGKDKGYLAPQKEKEGNEKKAEVVLCAKGKAMEGL